MDVVTAISDGNVLIVNQPSVKEIETDESFCTESSSVTNESEEAENETDALPTGPLSGFRRRRAEQVAARLSLQKERKKDREEERRRAEDEQKKNKGSYSRKVDRARFGVLESW